MALAPFNVGFNPDSSDFWYVDPNTGQYVKAPTTSGSVVAVVAGSGISVDSTDPANPIVSLAGLQGVVALGTDAIPSGSKATTITVSAPGTLSTDNLLADFNSDPTGVTGYAPSASGMLTIIKFCSTDAVNFIVVNNTGNSITPGAISLNWKVIK